jgi:hypothetical protein
VPARRCASFFFLPHARAGAGARVRASAGSGARGVLVICHVSMVTVAGAWRESERPWPDPDIGPEKGGGKRSGGTPIEDQGSLGGQP